MSEFTQLSVPNDGVIATVEDAARVLDAIEAAETWEMVWQRAKDPARLLAAIEVKLRCQVKYAVWRPV